MPGATPVMRVARAEAVGVGNREAMVDDEDSIRASARAWPERAFNADAPRPSTRTTTAFSAAPRLRRSGRPETESRQLANTSARLNRCDLVAGSMGAIL